MDQLTCQKCGLTADADSALRAGWLVAQRKDAPEGHLIVRCTDHRTGHALWLAGLPQQSQSRKVEKYLDKGLTIEYKSGCFAVASKEPDLKGEIKYYLLVTKSDEPFDVGQFDTLEALILAMRQVEPDLRKWRVRKE